MSDEQDVATLEAEIAAFRADYERAVGALVAEYAEVTARIAALTGEPAEPESAPPPVPPDEELKALFRRAAKAMHPDLAPDDATRAHAEAFTRRLTSAYRAGDAATIADLLHQWERGGRKMHPMDASVAQRASATTAARLEALRQSEFGMMLEASMAAALRGEDYLEDLRERWTVALADARARLDALTP